MRAPDIKGAEFDNPAQPGWTPGAQRTAVRSAAEDERRRREHSAAGGVGRPQGGPAGIATTRTRARPPRSCPSVQPAYYVSLASLLVPAMTAPIRTTASFSGFKSFLQVSHSTVG